MSRLMELISHLEAMNSVAKDWDFNTVISECGTCGCSLYQFPMIWPQYWERAKIVGRWAVVLRGTTINELFAFSSYSTALIAMFLDISHGDVERVFFDSDTYAEEVERLGVGIDIEGLWVGRITPQMVANELRKLVESEPRKD